MKINCKCGNNCDYKASNYEVVNNLPCNNSRVVKKCLANNKKRLIKEGWK